MTAGTDSADGLESTNVWWRSKLKMDERGGDFAASWSELIIECA